MANKNARCSYEHQHQQTTPGMFKNIGAVAWLVLGWLTLFGLVGVAISSRKLPETTFVEPRQVPGAVSEIASAVVPDNTVVGEGPTSVPAPATNTNAVIRTVSITLRPRLSSGTNQGR